MPKHQEVPFSHPRIHDIHASPRGLSQLVTTFFGTRAERSPSWVVASHVCTCTMRDNPSLSSHANAASSEDRLPEGRPSSALPPTRRRAEVLSNPPTYPLYMKASRENRVASSPTVPRSQGEIVRDLACLACPSNMPVHIGLVREARDDLGQRLEEPRHRKRHGQVGHGLDGPT